MKDFQANMRIGFLLYMLLFSLPILLQGQEEFQLVDQLDIENMQPQTKQNVWLKMIDDGMSQPVYIPVIILKGKEQHPVLGLTAALHGNELNGIRVIQEVVDKIDLETFNGTLIAIPGLNAISITQDRRRYIDEEDLNRNFPGKVNGNRSQQYVWQINQKVLTKIDYLIDMHTASFGRENTLYVRAKLEDEQIAKMARLQDADIILNSNGLPSTNEQISATRTMRAEAMLKNIPTITVEYGNPQVYQEEMIQRGTTGVQNVMSWLNMIESKIQTVPEVTICKKSYWIYINRGGYLEVPVELNQTLKKGDLIGVLRNPFGDIIEEYFCTEDGIVIGKSSNPINMNGGRIIHLGVME